MQIEVYKENDKWRWGFVQRGRVSLMEKVYTSEVNASHAAKNIVRGVLDLFPGQPVHFEATRNADKTRTVLRWSHK